MDDDAVRGLLEAAYRYTNAAGLEQFGADQRQREEQAAIDAAKAALTRLLPRP